MDPQRIAKLPKWAQEYIAELEAQRPPPCIEPPNRLDPDDFKDELSDFSKVHAAWTFNAYRGAKMDGDAVLHGCFSRVHHSVWDSKKANSQGRGGPWYATKSDAAAALILELDKQHRRRVNFYRKML